MIIVAAHHTFQLIKSNQAAESQVRLNLVGNVNWQYLPPKTNEIVVETGLVGSVEELPALAHVAAYVSGVTIPYDVASRAVVSLDGRVMEHPARYIAQVALSGAVSDAVARTLTAIGLEGRVGDIDVATTSMHMTGTVDDV